MKNNRTRGPGPVDEITVDITFPRSLVEYNRQPDIIVNPRPASGGFWLPFLNVNRGE